MLRFTIKLEIRPHKESEFRQVLADIQALAQKEPGTVIYDYFISENGTSVLAHEHYADSAAFMAHVQNTGHLFGPLALASEFGETTIAGDVSPEVRAMLSGEGHAARLFFAPIG